MSAFTPISFDHVVYLGSTLGAIAGEKAGILKPGVPCVLGRQKPEALAAIKARADEIGFPLHIISWHFDVYRRNGRLIFSSTLLKAELPLPSLAGQHQIDNAGSALAVATIAMNDALKIDALERGVFGASWPAWLGRLSEGTLHALVDVDTEVFVNGGHNPGAALVVANWLREMQYRAPREVHLIWGMMSYTDAPTVIEPFRDLVSRIYTVAIPQESNVYTAGDLAAIAQIARMEVLPTDGLVHALLQSRAARKDGGCVIIFGSLHLAGHVHRLNSGVGGLQGSVLADCSLPVIVGNEQKSLGRHL